MAKFPKESAVRKIFSPKTTPPFVQPNQDTQYCPRPHRFTSRTIVSIFLLTVVYFVGAKLGLLLAFVNPSATPVWPPTGIALTAFLIFGYKVWPGIFLGAFLANVSTAGSAATSMGIAVGNTLEGLAGTYLVNRFANGRNTFDRPQDVFKFALVGMASSMVSATFGVTSLCLGGYAHWADYGSIWLTWWLGDAGGSLIVTPVLVLWANNPHLRWNQRQVLEALLVLFLLFINGYLVFGGLLPVTIKTYPMAFLCVPILVWTGFRFSQRETVTAHFLLSGIAILGTLSGFGPFAKETPNESLLLLQAFMGVVGVMVMALASGVSERKRAEDQVRRLNAELETRVLERTELLQRSNKKLREESRERKRAEEQIRHNLERIRALHEIERAITSILDLQTILDVLLEKIDIFFSYPSATTVRLLNRKTRELESLACRNIDEREWRAQSVKMSDAVSQVVIQNRAPQIVKNMVQDPRTGNPSFCLKHGLISAARVPLVAEDDILGVLTLYTKQEHEFSVDEIESLTTLANHAAIAIDHAQLFEKLERANRVKDEFLKLISHELRTPLNVIMGYTAMVLDKLVGEINSEQLKVLGKVMGSSSELLGMIKSIIEASRIEAGGAKVQSGELNLVNFLDEIRLTWNSPDAVAGKQIVINWDYPSDLPTIQTDSEKLRLIIQNLLGNGVKFTVEGSVTLTVRHLPENSEVQFKVTDTGIGISKEFLPTLFQIFQQVDSSETRSYGGLGIGLYLVKVFTEMLGGELEAQSVLGEGSEFAVRLPVKTR